MTRPATDPATLPTYDPLKADLAELDRLSQSFGRSLSRALVGGITNGKSLSAVLRGLALSLSQQALGNALAGFTRALPGLAGSLFSGKVTPFAKGGIVNQPSFFANGSALGLAGEAGPEAILPLARGADGRLGVRSTAPAAGHAPTVNVTIAASDLASFRKSESQIAAALLRGLARGRRNL